MFWYTKKMVGAEVLKLRKNRSQVITASLLTIGVVVIYFAVLEILHLTNAASHGPAGGTSNFTNAISLLLFIGSAASIIIGARAGSIDQSSGVFRDLVSSGRSRISIYAARVAGAILFYLPFVVVALLVAMFATSVLHGTLPTPTASGYWNNFAVTIGVTIFNLIMALGIASLTLSRSITVGILLVWVLFAQRLIVSITYLGGFRKAFPLVAEHSLNLSGRGPLGAPITEGTLAAVAVLVIWSVVTLGVGAMRTIKMDA
ncbi:MAG: hypothetical protein M0T78_06945 [Actinomycetota bacterium]|nr:hypothetical protein [Actinomycetota bacterium]